MISIKDTIAGEPILFNVIESVRELQVAREFVGDHAALAMDTEASGVNCYRPGWRMRSFQFGHATESFVVPAKYKKFIWWAMVHGDVQWIAHNGPHDVRSIDQHLGRRTNVVCEDTYIPMHHRDSRSRDEGGDGHGLKDWSVRNIDRYAGKWEKALKEEFKKIMIPIEGQVYKSGPRKGTQKYRKAHMSEGWDLIDFWNPAYLAYAAADPVLTFRAWRILIPQVREALELYRFDQEVQEGYSELQRRAMRLNVRYTERLSRAYLKRAMKLRSVAAEFGCANIQSGDQIAATLIALDVQLKSKTKSGKWATDAELLRKLAANPQTPSDAVRFIRAVLGAKQMEKRRTAYTEAMLAERDENDRVHPSIRALAARTTRSSVSGPPLQQLPTKDHEGEIDN